LLDAAFQMVRARFMELILVTLVIIFPALVLHLVLPPEWAAVGTLFQSVLQNYATAAAVLIVADAYLGRGSDVKSVLRRTLDRFGSIFGAAFVQGFLIVLGVLLCIVPGIIAAIVTFAMPMAVVIEGASAMEAYERSNALARDQWGRIAGAYLLAFLLAFLASGGIGFAATLLGGSELGTVAEMLATVVFTPFTAVVGTLLYYDIRIRKEAFDLEMLLGAVDGPAAPAPAM
jgi:hypothetical protein